jgi:ATP-dependent Clp protease ATP-binding subunit ClpX
MTNDHGDRIGDQDRQLYCSFCNKSQEDVRKLVTGPKSNICNECIEVCGDIISDERTGNTAEADPATPAEPPPPTLTALSTVPVAGDCRRTRPCRRSGRALRPVRFCRPGDPHAGDGG